MRQLIRWLSNNHVLVVIFIALSASFLKWLGKAIKEQRERRQQAIDRERREIERIRTGRDPAHESATQPVGLAAPRTVAPPSTAAPPSAKESLEQIAARRRARMDQLRRQGAPATGQVPTAQPSTAAEVLGQILSVPGSAGPTVPGTRPPASRPGPRPMPPPSPTKRQTTIPPPIDPAKRRRQLQAQLQAQQQPPQRSRSPQHAPRPDDNSEVHRLVPDVAIEAPARRAGGSIRIFGQPATPADWRRAILLQEILGTPRSLADDSESILA